MLNTALRFMSECDSAGLKYRDSRDLDDGNSLVVCGINGRNNARYDIVFIFDKDGHSVQLRVFGLVSFPGEKADAMLKVANEMNVRYRWLKFCVNDMKVNVHGDAIISEENSGKICMELLVRTASIVDGAYPDFMRTLWS